MSGVIICVVLFVVFALLIYFVSISNNLKRLNNIVEQSKADIEIYMVKRYDVIMNSYKAVKNFTKHEEDMFTKLVQIRKGMDVEELADQAKVQNDACEGLLALAEAYPDLKSQELYVKLQSQLSDENEHYAAAKRSYNANVSLFNQEIEVFPNSMIAGSAGYTKKPYFEDDSAESKRDIEIF